MTHLHLIGAPGELTIVAHGKVARVCLGGERYSTKKGGGKVHVTARQLGLGSKARGCELEDRKRRGENCIQQEARRA